MTCFQRASPALKEMLLKLHLADKPMEIDHHLFELGSVEYHIKASASDPQYTYLSISTPVLSQGIMLPCGISNYTKQMVKGICPDILEIIEPANEGYKLTLKLDLAQIACCKDPEKVIAEISAMQAVILSSQLKEMLKNVSTQDSYQGIYKPVKLVYQPREPFFVIIQPHKILAVFPMRFKEDSDVIIATAFFQELMDVGSSEKWVKAPSCSWSPIPPPELRGEPFEDLSTNGGFVSFDILSRHVRGKRLDNTVWSLLNFYAYVKYHVKSTRGFIQRRMRKRLDNLVQVLHKPNLEEEEEEEESDNIPGCRWMGRLVNLSKPKILKRRCSDFSRKIKRIHSRIRIHGFGRFRRRWLKMPKFYSSTAYTKLRKVD